MSRANEILALLRHISRHPRNRKSPLRAFTRFAAWQIWKRLTGCPITLKVGSNRKFLVIPDSPFSSQVLYTDLPDWDEMHFLLRYLRAEDCFLDLGANVGLYTVLASTIVEQGEIFAIEASPRNIEILRRQIEINALTNVHILPTAVGEIDGTVRFATAQREMGSIVPAEENAPGIVELPCQKLDTLFAVRLTAGEEIALAKMDVEGCEMLVLAGAQKILQHRLVRAWLFEVGPGGLQAHGHTARELLEVFQQAGYSFHTWNESERQLHPVDLEAGLQHANLIACLDPGQIQQRLGSV